MDYSKMTDGEISVLIARYLNPKFSAVIHPRNDKGAQLAWQWLGSTQTTGFFPLSRVEELFPEMKKSRIGLLAAGKTVWEARHESGLSATHRNPLRAVAIVYLRLQEAK